MKKFLVSIFLIAAVGTGASAQNEQGGNQRPRMDRSEWVKRRTDMMVQKYGLDEKQAAALKELNEKQMMSRGNGQRPQRPEGAQAPQQGPRPGGNWQEMMKQYNEELQKIMTADQFNDCRPVQGLYGRHGEKTSRASEPPRSSTMVSPKTIRQNI